MSYFFIILVFIFGLAVGSFLNCLIWRLYKEETLGGRSYCPKCRQPIAWYDNLPLLSFIFLKGRCRHCQQKISWQYPLVEIITALLLTIIFLKNLDSLQLSLILLRDWLFVAGLIVVFVYDLRWQMIPMLIIWPLLAVIFILNLWLGFSWFSLLIFAVVGGLFFLIQYLLTKKQGVGEGDIWLGVLLGLAFPSGSELLLLLVISYGVGALISIILMLSGQKNWKSKIALGPFLVFGAIITLIWSGPLINWYFGLF